MRLAVLAVLLRALVAGAPRVVAPERRAHHAAGLEPAGHKSAGREPTGREPGGRPAARRRTAAIVAALAGLASARPAAAANMQHLSFLEMDQNEDGKVDLIEFMEGTRDELDAEGMGDKALRKAAYRFAKSLYSVVDADLDGVLDPREFMYAAYLARAAAIQAAIEGQLLVLYEFDDTDSVLEGVDIDGDGMVSREEFKAMCAADLVSWGWHREAMDSPEIKRWTDHVFDQGDMNGNGVIDDHPSELRKAGFLLFDGAMELMARILLQEFDENRDGKLSWQEFLSSRSPDADDMQNEMLRKAFVEADFRGDGQLGIMELYHLSANLLTLDRS